MRGHDQDDEGLTEQAAEWLVRLGDIDEADQCRPAFYVWLEQSPRHREVFADVAEWWFRLDGIDPQRCIDVRALLTDPQKVVLLFPLPPVRSQRRAMRRWTRRVRRHVAMVARSAVVSVGTVIVLVGLFAVDKLDAATIEYSTAIGERRVVRLTDGTFVHLNTHTQIEVRVDRDERTVYLLAGEALLEVAKDSHRPFKVVAGDVTIRDIGTTFNVRRSTEDVDVLVAEGSVQITTSNRRGVAGHRSPAKATELVAGQAATISYKLSAFSSVRSLAAAEIRSRLAWKHGTLSLDGRTLAELVAEINRYNTRTLLIDDPAIKDFRLGGSIVPTDLENFVRSLKSFGVTAEEPLSQTSPTEPIRLVQAP